MPRTTHGQSSNKTNGRKASKTYNAWSSMKRRCYDTSLSNYPRYGGRGITYDPRWESFTAFLEDMGEAPEGSQLDREDNDGPYCKNNCRWSTPKANSNNKSNNHKILAFGRTQTMTQWAEEFDMSRQCLYQRLKAGWNLEQALLEPRTTNQHTRGKPKQGKLW